MVQSLDLIVAITGAVLGIIIISLSFAWKMQQQDMGTVLFVACILYLALRKKISATPVLLSSQTNRKALILTNIVFLITFATSLLLLKFSLYYRSPAYFILVSVAATSVAVEIIFTSEKSRTVWIVLLKILVLCLSVRSGIFYEFPTLMGSDTWGHAEFASFITGYGHVPAREVYNSGSYNDFAIFHILAAATAIVASADLKDALFFSVGFISVASTLFIYLIGKSIGGVRLGLFAMLIAGMCDMFIVMGVTNILTGSLVLCWFMLIMFFQFRQPSSVAAYALTVLLFFVIILTHQLTTFVALVTFTGFLIGKTVYMYFYTAKYRLHNITSILGLEDTGHRIINVSLISVLILGISTLAYWMEIYPYESDMSFFQNMANRVISALTADKYFDPFSSPYVALFGSYSVLSNILYHPGYVILVFFSVIGALIWLSTKSFDGAKLAIITAILILYAFTYASPLTSARFALIPHRWLPFIYVMLAMAAAQAIIILLDLIKNKWSKIFAVSSAVLALTFFMLTTPYICGDSPLYDLDRASRSNFKSSEIQAASKVAQFYSGIIMIDTAYINVFSYVVSDHNLTCNRLTSNVDVAFTGMMLLRKVLLTQPTLVSASGTFGAGRYLTLGKEFFDRVERIQTADLVYSNGEAWAYIIRPGNKFENN